MKRSLLDVTEWTDDFFFILKGDHTQREYENSNKKKIQFSLMHFSWFMLGVGWMKQPKRVKKYIFCQQKLSVYNDGVRVREVVGAQQILFTKHFVTGADPQTFTALIK